MWALLSIHQFFNGGKMMIASDQVPIRRNVRMVPIEEILVFVEFIFQAPIVMTTFPRACPNSR